MRQSEEGRVEELSRKVGGRFKLTSLIQKQAREYYRGGRAFMPSVRNFDELFNYILDEIEDGKIDLVLPEEREAARRLDAADVFDDIGSSRPEAKAEDKAGDDEDE